MLQNLTGWHFLIILVVILLLFGAPKLPGLARSLGQSMKIFKSEITPDRTEDGKPAETSTSVTRNSGTRNSDIRNSRTDNSGSDSSGTTNPKA
jgi:sec-independent protein translocase protein TatA